MRFTITDTLPDGVKFISATDGSSYDEATRTVTWTVNVPATTQASVAVRVEILKEAEDTILKNHATVSVDEALKDTNEVQTPVIPTRRRMPCPNRTDLPSIPSRSRSVKTSSTP